jgi:hypothetical protein
VVSVVVPRYLLGGCEGKSVRPWPGVCLLRLRSVVVPLDFLTDGQVAAYGRFDGVPSRADLERFFFLDNADRDLIGCTPGWPRLSKSSIRCCRVGCARRCGCPTVPGTPATPQATG